MLYKYCVMLIIVYSVVNALCGSPTVSHTCRYRLRLAVLCRSASLIWNSNLDLATSARRPRVCSHVSTPPSYETANSWCRRWADDRLTSLSRRQLFVAVCNTYFILSSDVEKIRRPENRVESPSGNSESRRSNRARRTSHWELIITTAAGRCLQKTVRVLRRGRLKRPTACLSARRGSRWRVRLPVLTAGRRRRPEGSVYSSSVDQSASRARLETSVRLLWFDRRRRQLLGCRQRVCVARFLRRICELPNCRMLTAILSWVIVSIRQIDSKRTDDLCL